MHLTAWMSDSNALTPRLVRLDSVACHLYLANRNPAESVDVPK